MVIMINKNILTIFAVIFLASCAPAAGEKQISGNRSVETVEPASGNDNIAPLTTDEARQATY